VSTKDQTLSELHGEALLAARRPELQPLFDHRREVAHGRDDIRTECAGVIAGSWFAGIGKRGEDLIAAVLLLLAGHVDLDELDRWVKIGWERRRGASEPNPEGPNRLAARPGAAERGAFQVLRRRGRVVREVAALEGDIWRPSFR
jgi:hypothetical protein